MNTIALYLGVLEVILGLVYGILLSFFVFWLMKKLFLDKMEIRYDNMAFGVLLSFVLFSVGKMVSSALQPAVDFTNRLMNMRLQIEEVLGRASYTITGFFIVSTIVSGLIVSISFVLFNWLTQGLNEFEEIKNKNVAVALISGTIILVITQFVAGGMEMIFESFIPYPQTPRLF